MLMGQLTALPVQKIHTQMNQSKLSAKPVQLENSHSGMQALAVLIVRLAGLGRTVQPAAQVTIAAPMMIHRNVLFVLQATRAQRDLLSAQNARLAGLKPTRVLATAPLAHVGTFAWATL